MQDPPAATRTLSRPNEEKELLPSVRRTEESCVGNGLESFRKLGFFPLAFDQIPGSSS